jgi:Flp pilus assembly protein TadD
MMAFALYMDGRSDEAARISAQRLQDPNPFPYLSYIHGVSLLTLQSKDYETIENDLMIAARSIPQCSLCYVALSKVHRRKGELETATADLERAVELDPTLAEAWYNLATVYEQAGRHAEALSARRRFEGLKENKANLETEMLRKEFLKALGGEGTPQEQR